MEPKKNKKANLENKRNTLFLIGLVVSLLFVLLLFEWDTKPSKVNDLGEINIAEVEEEIIPITREKEIKPPPPPPPKKVIEILNIVDDDIKIENELVIEDSEANDETIIDVSPIIQKTEEKEEEKIYFNFIDEPAEFPGGERALYSYISNNVKYPVIAQENGIQGKVYLKFVVDKKGKVSNIEIIRGVDNSLDKEAIRVINSLPDFKPGVQHGRNVKVFYDAVINFMLQ